MKKTSLISLSLSCLLYIPLLGHAQVLDTQATSTEAEIYARIFTTCSQTAIENRDTSITAARSTYNTAMNKALNERKEKEKAAVAITDTDNKKAAIKDVVENYRKAALSAQETLTSSRKVIWDTFEKDIKNCRDAKDTNEATSTQTTGAVEPLSARMVASKDVNKDTKEENKTFFKSSFDALKAFFK